MTEAAPTPAARPVAATPQLQALYWSVRRELWEHRAFWIGPMAVGAVALFGALLSTVRLPDMVHKAAAIAGPSRAGGFIATPYMFVAAAVAITALLVAMVYSLGALHNERRDRSILFWKSLPVSDLTTVAAKAALPIVVLPVIQFGLIVVGHLIMIAVGFLVVAGSGQDLGVWWAKVSLPKVWLMLLRGLPFMAVWYAPLYGWFMMVSVWARRTPYLWAIAPPVLLGLVERLVFGTHAIWSWLGLRTLGLFGDAFRSARATAAIHAGDASASIQTQPVIDPLTWSSPHLWIGVLLAAVFFAASVWLRRSREPI